MSAARRTVRIPGDWQLHDSRDGELLLYSRQPTAHYRVTDLAALREIVLDEGGIVSASPAQ